MCAQCQAALFFVFKSSSMIWGGYYTIQRKIGEKYKMACSTNVRTHLIMLLTKDIINFCVIHFALEHTLSHQFNLRYKHNTHTIVWKRTLFISNITFLNIGNWISDADFYFDLMEPEKSIQLVVVTLMIKLLNTYVFLSLCAYTGYTMSWEDSLWEKCQSQL